MTEADQRRAALAQYVFLTAALAPAQEATGLTPSTAVAIGAAERGRPRRRKARGMPSRPCPPTARPSVSSGGGAPCASGQSSSGSSPWACMLCRHLCGACAD
jgi:hypothetical protein